MTVFCIPNSTCVCSGAHVRRAPHIRHTVCTYVAAICMRSFPTHGWVSQRWKVHAIYALRSVEVRSQGFAFSLWFPLKCRKSPLQICFVCISKCDHLANLGNYETCLHNFRMKLWNIIIYGIAANWNYWLLRGFGIWFVFAYVFLLANVPHSASRNSN